MEKLPQAKRLLVRNPGTDPGGSISTRKYKHSQPMFWKKQLENGSGEQRLQACGRPVFLSPPVLTSAGPIPGANSTTKLNSSFIL